MNLVRFYRRKFYKINGLLKMPFEVKRAVVKREREKTDKKKDEWGGGKVISW